ncbi:MAG: hypothetical protein DMG31_14100 [Acidobacteria bacterium]|nr:MAG: hypothetical protein DMG31_14100 [Acidobacteriota bacterium]
MYFRRTTEIHVDVINARKWYENINISTDGTRLHEISRYFDELLNPTTPDANPFKARPVEDSYYAMNDGAGFGLIGSEMSKLPSHLLPRRTLQDILRGPLAASDEDTTVSDSRNKFVELELAANLSSAGFKLLGFDDLKFGFEGCNYLVECKRPFYEHTLSDNMEKAYAQLQAKLSDSSHRGIVAIAVEKIFGLDRQIHPLKSVPEANAFAISTATDFNRRIARYSRTWVDPRVVAVLAIISLPDGKHGVGCDWVELYSGPAQVRLPPGCASRRKREIG